MKHYKYNKDVSSVIGPPNGVNYKSEELFKLGISENLQSIGNLSQYNDYFYNFITLGLVNDSRTKHLPSQIPLIYLFYHFFLKRMFSLTPKLIVSPNSSYIQTFHATTISIGKEKTIVLNSNQKSAKFTQIFL